VGHPAASHDDDKPQHSNAPAQEVLPLSTCHTLSLSLLQTNMSQLLSANRVATPHRSTARALA
jgi:hypothetical protein